MIDWQRICWNLRKHGSMVKWAKAIGVPPRTLQDLARGGTKEPKGFRTCLDLLDLHHDVCPELHRVEVIGEP